MRALAAGTREARSEPHEAAAGRKFKRRITASSGRTHRLNCAPKSGELRRCHRRLIDSAVFRDIFYHRGDAAGVLRREPRAEISRFRGRAGAGAGRLGIIPKEAAEEICRHCHVAEIDFAKLKTQTERIGYPVLPVVQQLVALCRDGLGEWCHWGATTQDITDTATVMQIREALTLIEADLDRIADALAALARKYRDTPMAGRSNLQQAVPITFGYKMATLLAAFERHKQRLKELRARVLVGEFGGAAGTLSSLGGQGLATQAELMKELKLGQPAIAWHTVRDTIAEVGCFLGLVTGTCGKIAFDIKLMMQTEVEELYEPFHEGRGSSSTMPQKRNPISSVYITALTAVVRQQVAALCSTPWSRITSAPPDPGRSSGSCCRKSSASPPARWRRPSSCSPACRSTRRRCAPISI